MVQDEALNERQLHCFGDAATPRGSGAGSVLQCAFRPAECAPQQQRPLLVAICRQVAHADDSNVQVWNCSSGEFVHGWRAGDQHAVGVAWSTCGTMLAAATLDGVARVWNVDTGAQVLEAAMPGAVLATSWSKNGLLAVGMRDGALRILQISK